MKPRSSILLTLALAGCGGTAPPAPAPAPIAPQPAARVAHDAPIEVPEAEVEPAEVSAPESPPMPAPAATSDLRIASVAYITWIYASPARSRFPLGYLRIGASAHVPDPEPVRGDGCRRGWYAVEPRGFVCLDSTTLLEHGPTPLTRSEDAFLRATAEAGPDATRPLPYGYALSMGSPMYGHVPTAAEQRKKEAYLGKPGPRTLGGWASGHDELATDRAVAAKDALPWFFGDRAATPATSKGPDPRLVRRFIPLGSMLSFSKAFEAEGRTWLVTPDLMIVPADRVRAFRPSEFHGVELDADATLPLAWIRKHPRPKLARGADGQLAPTGDAWAVRTPVALTGERVVEGGKAYLETREPGVFLAEADATVVERRRTRPPGAGPNDKWLDVSIGKGTLVAYEGDRPVFATLISPGKGGAPAGIGLSNKELVAGSHTPLGIYRIAWKDKHAAMSPDPGEPTTFWIADVPWTQYFRPPFALHAAFWHEDFGEPKSAGCVNLSPIDAKRVFDWSDPKVPDGWQGARPGSGNGPATVIAIGP